MKHYFVKVQRRMRQYLRDQGAANTSPPEISQDIKAPQSPARSGLPVDAANSGQAGSDIIPEKRLTLAIKAIRAARPIILQTLQKTESLPFGLLKQGSKIRGRQIMKSQNHSRKALGHLSDRSWPMLTPFEPPVQLDSPFRPLSPRPSLSVRAGPSPSKTRKHLRESPLEFCP